MTVQADIRLIRWLKTRATVQRETASLANLSITGNSTESVSASRSSDFYVQVEISGWGSTGTVLVDGLDSGSSSVQASLAFSGNHQRVDTNVAFRSISSVQTTGFSGSGTVIVRAVDQTGQPKEELTTVKDIMCAITRAKLDEIVEPVGGIAMNSAKIFMFPNNGVKRNDRITIDNEVWEVQAIQRSRNFRRERAADVALVSAVDRA